MEADPDALTTEVTTIIETNEERCWPSHHDYVQAVPMEDPPLMFCRLCGDVLEIKVQSAATTPTEV